MIYFKALSTQPEWNWMHALCHMIKCEDSQGIIGYDEKGIIKCGAVFDSFTVDACSVHLAMLSPMALRYGFLDEIAKHLFITCSRERVFGLVPSNNSKAIKLNSHLGWKEVTRIPDAVSSGVDYIVLRMDKEDCRWLHHKTKEEEAA